MWVTEVILFCDCRKYRRILDVGGKEFTAMLLHCALVALILLSCLFQSKIHNRAERCDKPRCRVSLEGDRWPFLVAMLAHNVSNTASHIGHSPTVERTENSIYAFAIACSRLDNPIYMPPGVRQLHKALLPLLLAIGVFCNGLTAAIMLRLGQSHLSVCLFAAMIAVLDLLLLLLPGGDLWLQVAFNLRLLDHLLTHSTALCNTFPFLFNFFIHLRAFLHLNIALDVLLLHWRPVHYAAVLTTRRVRTLFLIYLVLLLTINSQFLWTYDLQHITAQQDAIPVGDYCTYSIKWVASLFRDLAWPLIDFTLGEVLPLVVVGVCTAASLLLSWRHPKEPPLAEMQRYIVDVATFQQMRQSFLCLNTLFVCCVLPEILFYSLKYRAITNRSELQNFRHKTTTSAQAATPSSSTDHFLPYVMSIFIAPEVLVLYIRLGLAAGKFWLYFACSEYFRKHAKSRLAKCCLWRCRRQCTSSPKSSRAGPRLMLSVSNPFDLSETVLAATNHRSASNHRLLANHIA